jgi:hypothetical protein
MPWVIIQLYVPIGLHPVRVYPHTKVSLERHSSKIAWFEESINWQQGEHSSLLSAGFWCLCTGLLSKRDRETIVPRLPYIRSPARYTALSKTCFHYEEKPLHKCQGGLTGAEYQIRLLPCRGTKPSFERLRSFGGHNRRRGITCEDGRRSCACGSLKRLPYGMETGKRRGVHFIAPNTGRCTSSTGFLTNSSFFCC